MPLPGVTPHLADPRPAPGSCSLPPPLSHALAGSRPPHPSPASAGPQGWRRWRMGGVGQRTWPCRACACPPWAAELRMLPRRSRQGCRSGTLPGAGQLPSRKMGLPHGALLPCLTCGAGPRRERPVHVPGPPRPRQTPGHAPGPRTEGPRLAPAARPLLLRPSDLWPRRGGPRLRCALAARPPPARPASPLPPGALPQWRVGGGGVRGLRHSSEDRRSSLRSVEHTISTLVVPHMHKMRHLCG